MIVDSTCLSDLVEEPFMAANSHARAAQRSASLWENDQDSGIGIQGAGQ